MMLKDDSLSNDVRDVELGCGTEAKFSVNNVVIFFKTVVPVTDRWVVV
jgi:hypothetical protein